MLLLLLYMYSIRYIFCFFCTTNDTVTFIIHIFSICFHRKCLQRCLCVYFSPYTAVCGSLCIHNFFFLFLYVFFFLSALNYCHFGIRVSPWAVIVRHSHRKIKMKHVYSSTVTAQRHTNIISSRKFVYFSFNLSLCMFMCACHSQPRCGCQCLSISFELKRMLVHIIDCVPIVGP